MTKKSKNPDVETKAPETVEATQLYGYAKLSATERHAAKPFKKEPRISIVWDGVKGTIVVNSGKISRDCHNKAAVKRAFKDVRIADADIARFVGLRLFPGEAA